MKVTEPGLNKLIDNLNTLICEDSLLTPERETLVLAVAAIGAASARRLEKAMRRPLPDGKKGEKDRQPDPRFPRAGHPRQEDEKPY